MDKLWGAGLEVHVQPLFLQESTGDRDVDRCVEQSSNDLDKSYSRPFIGRQIISYLLGSLAVRLREMARPRLGMLQGLQLEGYDPVLIRQPSES